MMEGIRRLWSGFLSSRCSLPNDCKDPPRRVHVCVCAHGVDLARLCVFVCVKDQSNGLLPWRACLASRRYSITAYDEINAMRQVRVCLTTYTKSQSCFRYWIVDQTRRQLLYHQLSNIVMAGISSFIVHSWVLLQKI